MARFALALAAVGASAAPGHPVVVVGPLLAQSLEARISGGRCDTGGAFRWYWGSNNTADTLRRLPCLLEALEPLGWDNETRRTIDKPHVQVQPLGGFENRGFQSLAELFGKALLDSQEGLLVPRLRSVGYEIGESLFGHAYDWRLGVGDWEARSFPALKRLVEDAAESLGRGVVLTGNSLAGPYTHRFLSWAGRRDAGWARRHVEAFAPLNGVFNGAVMSLAALLSSTAATLRAPAQASCPDCEPRLPSSPGRGLLGRFESWFSDRALEALDDAIQPLVWKWPAMYFAAPGVDYSTEQPTDPKVVTMVGEPAACQVGGSESMDAAACGETGTYGGWLFLDSDFLQANECGECRTVGLLERCGDGMMQAASGLLQKLCCRRHLCLERSHRASELPELFRSLGRPDAAELMAASLEWHTTADPGVPVHCVISGNIQSWEHLTIREANPEHFSVRLGDGDLVANAESHRVCERWPSTVKVYEVPGVTHSGLLWEQHALDVLVSLALGDDAWQNWTSPSYNETTERSRADSKELFKVQQEPQFIEMV